MGSADIISTKERDGMFCHNCGKDCGDVAFCPACGNKILSHNSAESHAAGNAATCPNCGSNSITQHIGNPVEDDPRLYRSSVGRLIALIAERRKRKQKRALGQECVCLQCGHRWFTGNQKYRRFLKEIIGQNAGYTFPGADSSYISVMDSFVRIYLSEKRVVTIPYASIINVSFQKNVGPLYGWLSIRYTKNRRKKFPVSYSDALKDNCTIRYAFGQEDTYFLIYNVLRAIAEENRRSGIIQTI